MSLPTRRPTKPWTAFFASALVVVSSGSAASLTATGPLAGDNANLGSLAATTLVKAFCASSGFANTLYGIIPASITPDKA